MNVIKKIERDEYTVYGNCLVLAAAWFKLLPKVVNYAATVWEVAQSIHKEAVSREYF